MGIYRQQYWRGWQWPPPGNLPDSGIKPESLAIESCLIGSQVLYHWHHLGSPEMSLLLLLLSLQSCLTVRPYRRQPTRLPNPWDTAGKNSGVDCHFLLQCRKCHYYTLSHINPKVYKSATVLLNRHCSDEIC